MNNHLNKLAANWFSDKESWNSFNELEGMKNEIENIWCDIGSEALRKNFADKPSLGWKLESWDSLVRDTWWFLEEFGFYSVGIGYGWKFELCFGLPKGNWQQQNDIRKKLQEERFSPLLNAFGENGNCGRGFPLEQYAGKFIHDTNSEPLQPHQLLWLAGHDTVNFAEQAAAKIRKFTDNPVVTQLVRELNLELQELEKAGNPPH